MPEILLIFDCDGTLVDSESLGHIALARCLARTGVAESADDLLERYRGAKLAAIIEDLAVRHRWTAPASFVADYRNETDVLFSAQLKPTRDVDTALALLGNRMCVASSAPVEKIRRSLELTHILHWFEGHIYSSYDFGTWKPEPDLFLHAARTEGFEPPHCIVIEDSLVGVQAAASAGMRCLLYDPDGLHARVNVPGALRFTAMRQLPELVRA